MTESVSDDFFVPDGPPRDRWGRPTLIPRGGTEADRRWYTRASSLADMITDFAHIHKWKTRYLARGLGRTENRDLAALAGAEEYTTGFDKGDEKENRASGRRLDDIVERVLERQHISEKADYGTVVHAVTEPGNDGAVDWYHDAAIDKAAFMDCVRENGIVIIGTELFTANDDLWVAGTFDHLRWVPGYGIVITDKKTSSKVDGKNYAIQLSAYANADLLDWETEVRISLEEYLEKQGWDPALLDRTKGLIFWIKEGKCSMHELDLTEGYEAAHHAVWVRDQHRKGTGQRKVDSEVGKALTSYRQVLMLAINGAPSVDHLMAIWNNRENQAVWTPDHTAAATARREELERAS